MIRTGKHQNERMIHKMVKIPQRKENTKVLKKEIE